MALSKTDAETALASWIAADLAVSKGQSYSIAGRSLARVDAPTIRAQIAHWQNIVNQFDLAALGATRSNVAIAVKSR